MAKKLSQEQIEFIQKIRSEDYTIRKIVNMLSLSESVIMKYCKGIKPKTI